MSKVASKKKKPVAPARRYTKTAAEKLADLDNESVSYQIALPAGWAGGGLTGAYQISPFKDHHHKEADALANEAEDLAQSAAILLRVRWLLMETVRECAERGEVCTVGVSSSATADERRLVILTGRRKHVRKFTNDPIVGRYLFRSGE